MYIELLKEEKADAVILMLGKMVQRSSRRGCTEGCHQLHIRRMQRQETRGGPGSAVHCPMPSIDNGISRDLSVRFRFVCFLKIFGQEDKRHLVAGYLITLENPKAELTKSTSDQGAELATSFDDRY